MGYPGQKTLQRAKRVGDTDWWVCCNEKCENRFAKIIGGETDPKRLEILGANGQLFTVRPEYILLHCKKCGQENSLISGEVPTSVWQDNLRTLFMDNEGRGEDADFLRNQYLQGLLLNELTVPQKEFFRFMQRHSDGHWYLADAAREMNLSEHQVLERMRGVHQAQARVLNRIDKQLATKSEVINTLKRKILKTSAAGGTLEDVILDSES